MVRLISKIGVFVIPYGILYLAVQFLLPQEWLFFRVWEAVTPAGLSMLLPGPFYPNLNLERLERAGDLGAHSQYAVPKKMRLITDPLGFRTSAGDARTCEVVILGDSFIMGEGISQEELFSEQLQQLLSRSVYPQAFDDFEKYIYDPRFQKNPPKILLLAIVERNIGPSHLKFFQPHPLRSRLKEFFITYRCRVYESAWGPYLEKVIPCLDQVIKMPLLYFTRARIKESLERMLILGSKEEKKYNGYLAVDQSMLFYEGEKADRSVSDSEIAGIISALRSYQQTLQKQGIRFIFMPIPNKETIYFDKLPSNKKPEFLNKLYSHMQKAGIETIDLLSVYEKSRQKSQDLLYPSDDTHWSPAGVRLAAEAAAAKIRDQSNIPLKP